MRKKKGDRFSGRQNLNTGEMRGRVKTISQAARKKKRGPMNFSNSGGKGEISFRSKREEKIEIEQSFRWETEGALPSQLRAREKKKRK